MTSRAAGSTWIASHSATDPMLDTEILTTPEQLKALGPSWDALRTFLDAPFSRHAWVLSCAERLAAEGSLRVCVIRRDGTVVAAAPLIHEMEAHGEPGDFVYRDLESLGLLAGALAAEGCPLSLARVPGQSPLVEAIRRAYRRRGFVRVTPQKSCPFIDLENIEIGDPALESVPARLRSDLRRARRRAEALGAVSFTAHAPSAAAELWPLWERSLKVEAAGWKGRSRTALRLDELLGAFYRAYAVRASEEGILRILFLEIGSEVAATMIALETGGRFWILKIGYDERFAKCSPGMLLLGEALAYAAARRARSFELLGTVSEWTRRWTQREREMVSVRVYPYTSRGMAALALDACKSVARRVRRWMGTRPG